MSESSHDAQLSFMARFNACKVIARPHETTLIVQSPNREIAREVHQHWVADQLELSINDLSFSYDDHGRPCIESSLHSTLYISRSHRSLPSGEIISALSASSKPIGVDIELMDDGYGTHHSDIPWNILHHIERDVIQALAPHQRHASFIELWTLKEAYLKALGVGLMRAPEALRSCLQAGSWCILHDVETQHKRGAYKSANAIIPAISQPICVKVYQMWVCVVMLAA